MTVVSNVSSHNVYYVKSSIKVEMHDIDLLLKDTMQAAVLESIAV